ncbi:MAG TPA: hypothetical protein VI933_03605 [archaeon]|nr:hypothetical protein [archaeon]
MPELFFRKESPREVGIPELKGELYGFSLVETGDRGRNPRVVHRYDTGKGLHIYDCWIEVDSIPSKSPTLQEMEERGGDAVVARPIGI